MALGRHGKDHSHALTISAPDRPSGACYNDSGRGGHESGGLQGRERFGWWERDLEGHEGSTATQTSMTIG